MTEAVKLLPCPFCGSTNIDPEGWVSTERKGPACDECAGCADTVELWNSRPLSQAGAGGVVVKPLVYVKPHGSETLTKCETLLGDAVVWTHPEANGSWFWKLGSIASGTEANEADCKKMLWLTYEARIRSALAAGPSAAEPKKCWPFVESPGDFTIRLRRAHNETGDLLAAVRNVLIENPPTLTTPSSPVSSPSPAGEREAELERTVADLRQQIARLTGKPARTDDEIRASTERATRAGEAQNSPEYWRKIYPDGNYPEGV